MYGAVDAAWIAHAHGRANRDWARANRFYEGGWFGTALIAQAGTPDAREVAEGGFGLVIDLDEPEAALRSLAALDRRQLAEAGERLLAAPDARFGETDEGGRLAREIRRLSAEWGIEFAAISADESTCGPSA